jgi:hypothetical protein
MNDKSDEEIRKVVEKVSKDINKTYDDIMGKYDKLIKDLWINSEGNIIVTPITESQKELFKILYKQIKESNLFVDYNSKLKKLLMIKRKKFDFDKSDNCQKKNKEIIEFINKIKEELK